MSGPMSERAPDITVEADGHADSTTVLACGFRVSEEFKLDRLTAVTVGRHWARGLRVTSQANHQVSSLHSGCRQRLGIRVRVPARRLPP
jgi:hypothetical protein